MLHAICASTDGTRDHGSMEQYLRQPPAEAEELEEQWNLLETMIYLLMKLIPSRIYTLKVPQIAMDYDTAAWSLERDHKLMLSFA